MSRWNRDGVSKRETSGCAAQTSHNTWILARLPSSTTQHEERDLTGGKGDFYVKCRDKGFPRQQKGFHFCRNIRYDVKYASSKN